MSVKLIAENILDADDFYSATEQEGERWGQPEPASDNEGSMRPLVSGTPADFSYSGTATGDGAGGGTTVIDSALAAFGDDYFIGATVAITSGACSGESKTVTDFAQATGTLTTSAFSAQIVTGVTFTLTLAFTNRDFRVELTAGGDTGDATFKWSHNGGSNYMGRDDPNQADWLGAQTVIADIADTDALIRTAAIEQAANGDWVIVYRDSTDTFVYAVTSSDQGMTWGSPVTVCNDEGDEAPRFLRRLDSGRLFCVTEPGTIWLYSDDHGQTWAKSSRDFAARDFLQLSDGSYIGTYGTASVSVYKSIDEGKTWSSAITVVATAAAIEGSAAIIEAENGDLICAYETDEEDAGWPEIKCKISSDNGATWGSAIDVMDYPGGGTYLRYPRLAKDLDGAIYCVAMQLTSPERIVYAKSTDNGATWGAITQLVTIAATNLAGPDIKLLDGHIMACLFRDRTNEHYKLVRRGIWEAYSANACVGAPEALAQHLACGAEVTWYGGAGIAGDDWSFEPEYDFAMENLIEDSPSRPWRSEQDNIECSILLKPTAGAFGTHKIYADSVALFGCNLRTLDIEMCNDGNFTDGVDETVSFDLGTGTVEMDEVDDETGASWGEAYHGLSLADGQAFIRVEGVDISDYAGGGLFNFQHYCIVVHDSAAKKAKGYIADADAAQALGAELVTNGGFESGDPPDDWTAEYSAVLSQEAGGQAGNCLMITENGHTDPYAHQSFNVTEGKLYVCQYYVKQGTESTYRFYVRDASNHEWIFESADSEATGDWVQHTIYFTAPSGCALVRLNLYQVCDAAAATTIYFDTVTCKEITDGGTDGVHIMDTEDGTDQNWYDIEAGFDYNDDAYTFEVYVTPHNEVGAATFLASYKDHELKGKYLRFTSGGQSGNTYEILDNVGDHILLDTTDALLGVFDGDAFAVFGKEVALAFTGGPYRCARISISAQQTAENYYQIGSMVLGRAVTLTDAFDTDRGQDHVYDVELLRTPAGGLIPVQGADRKRRFTLTWSYSDAGRREVLALLDYIQGKNLVLIPDSADLTDVYLVKRVSDATQEWWKGDYATLEVELEEVL